MDIYSKKSRWKLYLAIAGTIIVLISTVYSNYLAKQLAEEEKKKVEQYFAAQKEIGKSLDEGSFERTIFLENYIDSLANLTGGIDKNNEAYLKITEVPQPDLTFYLNIVQSNTTIPVMLVGEDGTIIPNGVANFGTLDSTKLAKEYQNFLDQGIEPIISSGGQQIYYKSSTLLRLLRYLPFVQFGLIGAFILFGYLAFSSARKAQENRVWVGMAKETAHQLGTPISAIIGWIEHLKLIREEDEEILEVTEELRKDVTRLELVADRFSKIGSEPELKTVNVYEELERCRAYMERRAPRKVSFDFPHPNDNEGINININQHLFDWVIENLLRNALDAMGGKGQIKVVVYQDKNDAFIDVSDTGYGIPTNKFKSVFNPGFTTKKRGWGLGLSLAKRIIEKYHTGKIFVKKSIENKGTTFTIQLPKN